jgi:hypothetical protein
VGDCVCTQVYVDDLLTHSFGFLSHDLAPELVMATVKASASSNSMSKKVVVLTIEEKGAASDLLRHIAHENVTALDHSNHFILALVKSCREVSTSRRKVRTSRREVDTSSPTIAIRLCLLGLANGGGRVRASFLYAFPDTVFTELQPKGHHHVICSLISFEDIPLGKTFVVLDEDKYAKLRITSALLKHQVVYVYKSPFQTSTPSSSSTVLDTTLIVDDTTVIVDTQHSL